MLYIYWLTRNVADPTSRHELRDDESFMLTKREAGALTPAARRLLDLIPGGTGARAVVQIGEHLSVLFVLLSYSERTAPLRESARNGRAARPVRSRPARPGKHESPPQPTTTGGTPVEHQRQDAGAAGTVIDGPAIGPGVIGSQYA